MSGFDVCINDDRFEPHCSLTFFSWDLISKRIATSFTAVVNSLITDIVLPPFSLIPNPFSSGSAGGLEEKFLILKPGQSSGENYNTRAQAIADGALILSYGYALVLLNPGPTLPKSLRSN